MQALTAIRKRRSVRDFTGAAVPRPDLEQIVDAGRLAPSGRNQQPWEFIVVTRPAIIAQMKMVADWIDRAGAVVGVVLDPASRWWVEDGAAAVENMLIAATALGYGSCWLEGYTLEHEEELKELLGVPAERRLLTLIPIGVPVAWPEQEKRTLAEVIHWEQY
jgi:nitroreductase